MADYITLRHEHCTHVWELNSEGYPVHTLCGRGRIGGVHVGAFKGAQLEERPTCSACARKDPRVDVLSYDTLFLGV